MQGQRKKEIQIEKVIKMKKTWNWKYKYKMRLTEKVQKTKIEQQKKL
jgi:hypothetical protein